LVLGLKGFFCGIEVILSIAAMKTKWGISQIILGVLLHFFYNCFYKLPIGNQQGRKITICNKGREIQ